MKMKGNLEKQSLYLACESINACPIKRLDL